MSKRAEVEPSWFRRLACHFCGHVFEGDLRDADRAGWDWFRGNSACPACLSGGRRGEFERIKDGIRNLPPTRERACRWCGGSGIDPPHPRGFDTNLDPDLPPPPAATARPEGEEE